MALSTSTEGRGRGRNFRYQDNRRICLDMVKSASWCNTKKAVALIGDNVQDLRRPEAEHILDPISNIYYSAETPIMIEFH